MKKLMPKAAYIMLLLFMLCAQTTTAQEKAPITTTTKEEKTITEWENKPITSTKEIWQPKQTSFTFVTDQDFFYFVNPDKNEDRNYTQGTSFALSNSNYYKSWLFFPIRLFNRLVHDSTSRFSPEMSTIGVTGTAFTPEKIDDPNPVIGDRPFAFLLALSTSQIQQVGKKIGAGSDYEAITFNYGLFGTNVGYWFQSFAHKNIIPGRPENPVGWNTQISKGGRLALLFNYERWKGYSTLKNEKRPSAWGLDGFLNLGGSLGYYDRAYTGIYTRFGWLDPLRSSGWALNSMGTVDKNSMNDGTKTPTKNIEVFGFTRATYTYMHRNAMLVGQRYANPNEYRLDEAWIRHHILDIDFGLGFGIYWIKDPEGDAKQKYFKIQIMNTIRSPEFNSHIFPKRWHYFGGVNIQFPICG